MAKQKEKKPLDKKGWVQTFELIGKACIKDYTFKIDEHKSHCFYQLHNHPFIRSQLFRIYHRSQHSG